MMAGPILIAGRRGRVAPELVAEAARLGVTAQALGRPDLDIEDAESIARVMTAVRPRAIVNLAGVGTAEESDRDPAHAFALNRDGAARLATAAARVQIPFLHISSDFVFDGGKRTPYREDDPALPINVYGHSKLAGKQAVREAYADAFIFRTAWVYGPHGRNFFTAMLRLAATQEVARVVADQTGSPTAGPELARALLDIAARLAAGFAASPGVYHLAGSGETSWKGFAEAIFSGLARRGHQVPRVEAITMADWPSPAQRPAYSALDCSKLARTFGIVLPPWPDSLERCLDMAHAKA